MSQQKKLPWVAALLNIFGGLGYIYNGKRVLFGILISLTSLLGFYIITLDKIKVDDSVSFIYNLMGIITLIIFPYDAYQEANELNSKK